MKRIMLCLALALSFMLQLAACGGSAPASGATASTPSASIAYPSEAGSSEQYLDIKENTDVSTEQQSMLTFSLKVDTAAYTNVARYIENGQLPPGDAVRTEELLNYFSYEAPLEFHENTPFATCIEIGPSPFHEEMYLAYLRVKTHEIDTSDLPPSNLTFLIDTSGSMDGYDKLPLLKEAFSLLVETLDEDDRVSIVTYAGSAGVVLSGANGGQKDEILSAINNLTASGSTAGAKGIMTAYELAEENFLTDGNNRIILATDGDFNVGLSSTDELAKLVGEKRGNGIYMSILGFGTGNIRDDIMETLSKEGNGNYSYISDLAGAQKVLVEELSANLFTVADDVKAQVEFNPQNVSSYRLIGYENRQLTNEDFADDSKDAGEIGAGTDVILLFEVALSGSPSDADKKYATAESTADFSDELFELRIRYKNPGESESQLITTPAFFDNIPDRNSTDFNFAAAVAIFGHLLRDSEHTGYATLSDAYTLAEDNLGSNVGGYRHRFLNLLETYDTLT